MGADVRRSEPGPGVVAVIAEALGEALGIGEIPARCRWVALSGRGHCGDQQQGAPYGDQGRVSVGRRGQVVGAEGSNLFGVSAFAASLPGAGQLVTAHGWPAGRAAAGRRARTAARSRAHAATATMTPVWARRSA